MNDWKRTAEKLREQLADAGRRESGLRETLALERARIATLQSYLADRDEMLKRYEVAAEWTKSREVAP
jgi:hypothetical protein